MATEITEYVNPPMHFGESLPLYPLPEIKSTAVTVGTVFTPQAATKFIMVQPGEDVRMGSTTDGTDPTPSTGTLLKAGGRYDFSVPTGLKMKGV